jgi:hypothetical protein
MLSPSSSRYSSITCGAARGAGCSQQPHTASAHWRKRTTPNSPPSSSVLSLVNWMPIPTRRATVSVDQALLLRDLSTVLGDVAAAELFDDGRRRSFEDVARQLMRTTSELDAEP